MQAGRSCPTWLSRRRAQRRGADDEDQKTNPPCDQPLPPAGQRILALPTRAPEETRPSCRDPPDREHISRRFGIALVKQQLGRHELRGPEAPERLGHPLPGLAHGALAVHM